MDRMEGGSTSSFTSYNNLILANCHEGMNFNGCMSAVRKFFCLFVTFDFLFIALFWVICVLISNHTLFDVWEKEIVEYTFSGSSFDVVICAFLRFSLLLLFYGIIQISHWWFIVVSTTLTCIFVGVKSCLYVWNKDNSYPFEVMIFLLSFIIAWAELWFIEVRVLPQERQAIQLMDGVRVPNVHRNTSDTPVIARVREFLSHHSDTGTNFYSPLESPIGSEYNAEEGVESKELTPQEFEWIHLGENTMYQANEVLQSDGWKEEKRISDKDVVYSKSNKQKNTVYKLEAVISCSPVLMFNDCIKNFESIPTWNKAVVSCKIVKVIDSKTDITYNVAAEGGGGLVSARDFVSVRRFEKIGDSYLIGGASTSHSEMPVLKKFVRGENGPNCVKFTPYMGNNKICFFQMLLDVNLKGWIPKGVISQALIAVLCEFRDSVIRHAETIQNPGR